MPQTLPMVAARGSSTRMTENRTNFNSSFKYFPKNLFKKSNFRKKMKSERSSGSKPTNSKPPGGRDLGPPNGGGSPQARPTRNRLLRMMQFLT